MSESLRYGLAAGFMLLGLIGIALSVLGVFKFRFVMNRMHCAAIIDTMGALCVLISLILATASLQYIPKLVVILAVLWLGSPISSHLVSRLEISTDKTLAAHMRIGKKKEQKQEEEPNHGTDGSV